MFNVLYWISLGSQEESTSPQTSLGFIPVSRSLPLFPYPSLRPPRHGKQTVYEKGRFSAGDIMMYNYTCCGMTGYRTRMGRTSMDQAKWCLNYLTFLSRINLYCRSPKIVLKIRLGDLYIQYNMDPIGLIQLNNFLYSLI